MAILELIKCQEIVTKTRKWLKKRGALRICDYLEEQCVCFLQAKTRNEALYELVKTLEQAKHVKQEDNFYDAILKREKIVSTGIGMGVAVPHAKIPGFANFFIALGVQQGPGIDWNSLDNALVRLVFMIGGPEDHQTEYLQILSHLTNIIKEENLRKTLLLTNNTSDLYASLRKY